MASLVPAPVYGAVARGRASRARCARAVRASRVVAGAGDDSAPPLSPGWRTPAMCVFWDLDNLRPPSGYETLWAYRLVEADVGVTFTRCPPVAEGADVVLSTDVANLVRGGGCLARDATDPTARDNEAAKAVASAESFGVMVCTRDEGMAECVAFAKARRDLCDGVVVAGEFVAKNMHRPQFARAMGSGAGDVGLTEGYWRVMTHVAGKTDKGILGKSALVRAADATILWDSKRLFDMPGGDAVRDTSDEEAETVEDPPRTTTTTDDSTTTSGRSGTWTPSTPRRGVSPRCSGTARSSRGRRERPSRSEARRGVVF